MTRRAPRYVPAITGIFWVAASVGVIVLWQPEPDGALYWLRGVVFALLFLFGLGALRDALLASDGQIRAMVDGDGDGEAAQRALRAPGLVSSLWRLVGNRKFVIAALTCAVAAFFFIDQYAPRQGLLGNALIGEIPVSWPCGVPAVGGGGGVVVSEVPALKPRFPGVPVADAPALARKPRFAGVPVEPDCRKWLPYRWIALAAVFLIGAHLIARTGARA